MKKVVYFSVLIALFSITFAQAQGVRYGFKLGLNASSISSFDFNVANVTGGDLAPIPSGVDEGRVNFTVAFFGEFTVNQLFSIQPELTYSTQGNNFGAIRYDALQLPIGLRFNFENLYIIGGPQVGLKISDSEQSDNFSSFEFAAFGGLGYHITQNIFINARYTFGFSELFEDDASVGIPVPQENSNQNDLSTRLINLEGNSSYFTIGVGYRI